MELAKAWTEQADNWIAWARADGHDSYWRFHRQALFGLLPPPGRLTIDLGCGEGRVARDLTRIGHRVIGFDLSEPMIRSAADHDNAGPLALADSSAMPVRDGVADLAVAFMSLQDMDRPEEAVREAWRMLEPGGRLHLAIVHPINSAGGFEDGGDGAEPAFVIAEPYLARRVNQDEVERNGYRMRFDSEHRPLELYSQWLERAGFVIERMREVGDVNPDSKWHRLPLFLHLAAIKPVTVLASDRRVFHIAAPTDVELLEREGELRPPSLAGEGFVHLSRAGQVVPSTERHFPPEVDLVLLELDVELLVAEVRWPEVYPGERFPHLHGPLRLESVVAHHRWGPAERATWGL